MKTTAMPLDPILKCMRAMQVDFLLRSVLAIAVGVLCWREVDSLVAAVAFTYVFFFVPTITSREIRLRSGRMVANVRPKITWCLHGRNLGKQILDVTYTCFSDELRSLEVQQELQQEFQEVCAAVFSSCDLKNLDGAEITAELPLQGPFWGLNFLATVIKSAEFEKTGRIWAEIEP